MQDSFLISFGVHVTERHVGQVKVLVVDDEQDLLDTTVQLFELMGYEVLSANNGSDALEIIRRTPEIKILFTDVLMSGIDGVTLGQEASKLVPGIKVILVSGFPALRLAKISWAVDDFHFLSKPYLLSDIWKILRKAGV